jgi:hypothetical protein
VRIHEAVHVEQFQEAIANGWCSWFWGCFAPWRTTAIGIPALEVPAYIERSLTF